MIIEDYEDWLLMQDAYDLFTPYIAQRDQREQHNGKKTEKRKKYRKRRKNKLILLVLPYENFDPFLDDEDLP